MPWILSGFRHDSAGPYLILSGVGQGQSARRTIAIRGTKLSLRWGAGRYCTGYFDLIDYRTAPCPNQASLADDETACVACARRTGFNPSFYNLPRSALSPQQRTYNERPHVVYLAGFSRFRAKVGISSRDRVLHRWRGQGARLALLLAMFDDAYDARDCEARVSRTLALPEQVRGATKRALINEPLDVARVSALLERTRREAEAALALPPLAAPLTHLDPDYLGEAPLTLPVTDLTDAEPACISGVGLGMIGDVLIVAQENRQYMIGLARLLGRTIDVSDVLRDNPVRPGGEQLGFGF
jgi:hypothetical protein